MKLTAHPLGTFAFKRPSRVELAIPRYWHPRRSKPNNGMMSISPLP